MNQRQDRTLHINECDDLFQAMERRTVNPEMPAKFGTLHSEINQGTLKIVLELDVKKMPAQLVLFPQVFFKNWLKNKFQIKS